MIYNNPNRKENKIQKLITYSSSIDNDSIKQKSVKMISNGKKTKVNLYSRDDDYIRKKSMQFDNNKTNLANLLKVDPVFEDLDSRLYKDFLVNVKSNRTNKRTKRRKKHTSGNTNGNTNGKISGKKITTQKYYKSKSKSKSKKNTRRKK
jgi:hypothetical protein|uniref:Uncharacterized protein n=1 Tax=viral metagenome TaxID=1070528 RepID=A0A6C0IN36_9ZZZZ